MNARASLYILGLLFCFNLQAQTGLTNKESKGQHFGLDTLLTQSDYPAESDFAVANFSASDTLITVWEAVHFTNLSTGNPTFFKWFLPGASPSLSYVENPVVIYHTPGIYDVTLTISGVSGSDTLIKMGYIEVLPEPVSIPPGWEYEETTSNHPIFISLTAQPRIFEVPIQAGDFIGVFYLNDNDSLKCAGAAEWNDTASVAIVAFGDDPLTPAKEGFSVGEAFSFKIFSLSQSEDFPASVTYDSFLSFSSFFPGAMTALEDIHAGESVEVVFHEGWHGVSSFVLPWENQMEEVFSSNPQNLIVISDGEKYYTPDAGMNTLEVWGNKGYLVKMNSDLTIQFNGYPPQDLFFALHEGWNILPVPLACEVEVIALFNENLAQLKLIKEIAGINMFWPEQSINSLHTLEPGKAYEVYVSSDVLIEFPVCE